ncbi:MAG: hypothetical protein ACI4LX_12515 [Treponema sp.]
MVKKTAKKISFLLAVLVYSVFTAGNVFADVKPGAEISLNSGWLHLDSPLLKNKDFWYSSAQAKIKLDASFSSAVKAYIECRADVSSVPEMINPADDSAIPATVQAAFSLHKAYMKFRLPFGLPGGDMRIAAGKMPLSWGYGLFYNAGDLIFGSDPLNSTGADSASATSLNFSSSSLSDFRTATDWIFALTVPLVKGIQLEAVALPPIENAALYNYGRFGGRAQFNTELAMLENIEAGYLADGNLASQRFYVSLDGNLWLDYNVNVSAALKKDEGFDNESFECSLALSKVFYIQTDVQNHQLQLRAESLWAPFKERLGVFGFISYQVTETVSLSGTYIFCSIDESNKKIDGNSHYAGISVVWEPISALELSLEGMLNVEKPEELANVSAGIKYRY